MGIFDMFASLLGNKDTSGKEQAVLTAVAELANAHTSGVTGLMDQLNLSGTSGEVARGAAGGINQPASSELIQQVVSSQAVSDFAGKFGLSPEQASNVLGQVLPLVLQHGTVNGQPQQGDKIDPASVVASIKSSGGLATLAKGLLENT